MYNIFMSDLRIRRDILTISNLHDSDEKDYWKSASPTERLEAVQIQRENAYGKDKTAARLQRVLEIFKR